MCSHDSDADMQHTGARARRRAMPGVAIMVSRAILGVSAR